MPNGTEEVLIPLVLPGLLFFLMNWVPQSAVDNLPDDVLATILKLVADLPVLSFERDPPAPVAASRVSRRWRIVALGSPELWTNIRISHLLGSRRWAATFVKRSLSRPLDISINLESHRDENGWKNPYCIPHPLNKVLAIVGPHIGRWRTLALRGWSYEMCEFLEFVRRAPVLPSRLEYTHLSGVEGGRLLLPVEKLCGSESFSSLRVKGMELELASARPFIILGLKTTLTTGALKQSPTPSTSQIWDLEIRGGFTIPYNRFKIPEDWETPLFPHLRTLRLEDSFSRDITALQLINTAENQHLLVQPGAWPALRALTVEAPEVPEWIAPFVAMRSALGRPILDLTLPLCDRDVARTLAARKSRSALAIHLQHSGPSPALRDGVYGPGYYVNECNMRPADFVQPVRVRTGHYCEPGWGWQSLCPECRLEQDKERVEEEIEGDFKLEGEVARSKGTQREARKQRRRAGGAHSASRSSKAKQISRNRRRGFIEDFSIVWY
ncbi:hypothetical protein B0H14DRAFT_3167837 [Mycena olivaceomarginata]|nr:hypothetical protein B0H14DRAFT_3167837 [Mycena olivaceomarginata]